MLWMGTVLAILGAIVCWKRPQMVWWWTLTWAVGLEVIHHWYQGVGQYLPFAGGAVGALLAMGWSQDSRELMRRAPIVLGLWGLYVLSIILSTLVSIDPAVSVRYVIGVPVVLGVTLVVLPALRSRGDLVVSQLLTGMALAGLGLSVVAGAAALLFGVGFPVPVGHHTLLAWEWPFANKNTLGMLLMYALPSAVALAVWPDEGRRLRWPWIGMTLWLLLATILSYARTAWIAGLAGVAVVLLVRYGKRAFWAMLIGVVALGGAAVAVTGVKRWQHLWAKGLNGRLGLWQAALHVLHHHLWLGVGPGNSPMAIKPFVPAAFAGLTPHDSLLRTAVELGAVGLAIWLMLTISALYRLFWGAGAQADPGLRFLGAVLVASVIEQMAESLLLGGVSFGDYFFTLLMSMAWMAEASQPMRRLSVRQVTRLTGR